MATSTCSLVSSRGLLTTGYYLPLTSYYSLLTIYYLLLATGEDESSPNKLLVFTHCPLSSGTYGRTSLEGSGCVTCAGKEIRHLPRATCYLPPATCYLPPTTYHLLPTTCYLLRISTVAGSIQLLSNLPSALYHLLPASHYVHMLLRTRRGGAARVGRYCTTCMALCMCCCLGSTYVVLHHGVHRTYVPLFA